MRTKDIFNSPKQLENLANQILYQFVSKGTPYTLPANIETFVKDGYSGNVNIYPIIRKIINPAIGVKWELNDRATEEEATDQTMMMLLKNPNASQSFNQFVDEAMAWRLTTGNRYIYWMAPESGPNKGKPAEIHLLPASQVEIVQGDWLQPVKAYHLTIGNIYKEIPAERVIHGKTTNLQYDLAGSQLYGMSPLQAALKIMTATNHGYDRMTTQFEQGGPDYIITGTKDTATQEWTPEQKQTFWDWLKSPRFKKDRFHAKNLPIELHELGKSIVDMNVLEYIKLSLRDYCNIYGVPSALMNDNEYATQSANAREYQRQLWNNAIIPELDMLKEDFNKLCGVYNKITGQDLYFDYCLDDIPELQTDNSTQAAALAQAWWLTPDEKRDAMGKEETNLPEMQTIYAPMGTVPLSDISNEQTPEDEAKALNGIKY